MTITEFSLIFSPILSSIVTVGVVYLGYQTNKELSKYNNSFSNLMELHRKLHDRLVEVESYLKKNEYINEKTKERLLMTSSRLTYYDESILTDVHKLLNLWEIAVFSKERKIINDGQLSKERLECNDIIKNVKTKVNKQFKLAR